MKIIFLDRHKSAPQVKINGIKNINNIITLINKYHFVVIC